MKKVITAIGLALCILIYNSIPVLASPVTSDVVETNEIPNWPTGPELNCQAAILMEANTGVILYAKNQHERLYPASTTKLLTVLLANENSQMDEVVSFSHDAVFSLEEGSSNIGIDPGQSITMEQCLYGILVYSANEVCNAVAEHIAGDTNSYVELMNQKAAALGCTNSHFVTTNGLHDENHYTSPRDLALIACEFFKNPTLAKMAGTSHYYIGPTATQPDIIDLYTHNKLTNNTYPYDGYIGGKTGYTTVARQTLVSCAERNGMKLVCVVMKEESPYQFTDTIKLFDYGFNNFSRVNIADSEENFTINDSSLFDASSGMSFHSESLIEIQDDAYLLLPNTIGFKDLNSQMEYGTDGESLAKIHYSYQGIDLGTASVIVSSSNSNSFKENMSPPLNSDGTVSDNGVIYINVLHIAVILGIVLVLLIIIIGIISFIKNYHFARKRRLRTYSRTRKSSHKRGKDGWGSDYFS